jgi:hypothetical protein
VSTLAGSSAGYADDLGTRAQFCFPRALTIDDEENVLVVDECNHKVRKITPQGASTFIFIFIFIFEINQMNRISEYNCRVISRI